MAALSGLDLFQRLMQHAPIFRRQRLRPISRSLAAQTGLLGTQHVQR